SKCFQQSISLFICFCCSHQRDVHPGDLVDLFDADFWKYDLLADSQGIVTSSVKPFIIDSPEVTYPWQGHRDQTVKEFIHPIASQSYLSADRHAFSQLKVRNGNFCFGRYRTLTGDDGKLFHSLVNQLLVSYCRANAFVDHDLG